MKIELPILVESRPHSEGGLVYVVRPLFFPDPCDMDRDLGKATSKLAASLKRLLTSLGRAGDHRRLADYSFCPDARLHRLELVLDLPGMFVRASFPVAEFRHADKHLAFSPYVPETWFEVAEGERLQARAAEVFTRHFRDLQKSQSSDEVEYQLRPFREKRKRWLSLLEVEFSAKKAEPSDDRGLFAMLGGGEKMSGVEELERVGRPLDRLYPDHLDRALLRDDLVRELEGLLEADDLRPVMLVGPSMVGKTALVHEVVFRRVERRRATRRPDGDVWLLSPQRLVSGMSYVGQWENRVLAILKATRKRRHVLYFDDVLGLYRAGVTCQSDLSVADVLKPYVERREVRVLAEMTPEALRVFRERDRGLADQFHLLPVDEPGDRATLRILIGVVRRLEARYRVRFGPAALPTVLELARRYQREAAFPGKAARSLSQLAVKHQKRDVDRRAALDDFHAKSGLDVAMLDARARLPRDDVVQGLASGVIGQQAAIEAMADVVSVAKARLNDPGRPLGTLLFLGPTGVGKTQSAKALAAYLFGDASRMLRFDMNEFVSPQSAARLVGTFTQPEGLLTAAMRRQPFAVVLFDEIEKAHPDVFDLLLQILGEARLTDALGRTADFSGAIVILTSNLGTQEAARELGFGPRDEAARAVYLKAVREFFRPEFLNRLDRIVPFARLDRGELAAIARSIIAEVAGREGLARRKCAINITGDAVEWVIDRGFHRMLGARAMRRAVEREMVRPIAVQLAAISPELPTVLSVGRRGDRLVVEATGVANAERLASSARPARLDDLDDLRRRAGAAIARIRAACALRRPKGELVVGSLPPDYLWYLGAVESLRDAEGLAARLAAAKRRQPGGPVGIHPRPVRRHRLRRWEDDGRILMRELCAASDIDDYLRELASRPAGGPGHDDLDERRHLLDVLALLEMLAPGEEGWTPQRVLAVVRSLDEDPGRRMHLAHYIECKFLFQAGLTPDERRSGVETAFGLDVSRWRSVRRTAEDRLWWETIADASLRDQYRGRLHLDVLAFEGHRAERFLRPEHATHLYMADGGHVQPVQVVVVPMMPDQGVGDVLADCLRRHDRALAASAQGETPGEPDPFAWQPVAGVYTPGRGLVVDFRTGWTSARDEGLEPIRAMMASLALPPEFGDTRQSGEQ